jgi:hypothetical protein
MSEENKRLRLMEPDLEITCKSSGEGGDTVGQDDGSETSSSTTKTYHYHSVVMANYSKYFDTSLTSGLEESITKKFVLEDVAPETFELAMSLLEDPSKANAATPDLVAQVAPFYNRFMFDSGTKLVEAVLLKLITEWTTDEQAAKTPKPFELDQIAGAIKYAHDTNHEAMLEKSKRFWLQRIGSSIWDHRHLRKIQKFIIQRCAEINHDYFFKWFNHEVNEISENQERLLNDPDFPAYLMRKFAIQNYAFENIKSHPKIKVHVFFEQYDGQSWTLIPERQEEVEIVPFQRDTLDLNYWGNGLHFFQDIPERDILYISYLQRCPNARFLENHQVDARPKELFQQQVFQPDDWILKLVWGRQTYYFAAPLSRNHMLPPQDSKSWMLLTEIDPETFVNEFGAHPADRIRAERVGSIRLEYV